MVFGGFEGFTVFFFVMNVYAFLLRVTASIMSVARDRLECNLALFLRFFLFHLFPESQPVSESNH